MKKIGKIRKLDRDNFISKVKFLLCILLFILTNVTAEITYSAENNLAYSSVIGFIHNQKVIRMKEEASKPENDRIYRAIEEVIKLNQ